LACLSVRNAEIDPEIEAFIENGAVASRGGAAAAAAGAWLAACWYLPALVLVGLFCSEQGSL